MSETSGSVKGRDFYLLKKNPAEWSYFTLFNLGWSLTESINPIMYVKVTDG
jgi:hypothetical protein